MRVLLIRHAKAVPRGTSGIPDDERPVTPEGEERFRAAARGLARIVEGPAAILTSPLPRARRTAEIAAESWGKSRVKEVGALADGSLAELTRILASFAGDETVAMVGHEPHLSGLLAHLLGAREGDSLTFRKGGAALVELPGAPSKGGTLLWFIPPKILRLLADD
jgi:phosphohistidine phosphatase